jgi:ribose-phosphate pyrophosphokinase
MIKVNDIEFQVKHFPSGEQNFTFPFNPLLDDIITIEWYYENDSELFTLINIVQHIRNKDINKYIGLFLPYIPHARMDRVENSEDVFTLKYFTEVINSLKFNRVDVFDPHSNVSTALLNNVNIIDINRILQQVIEFIKVDTQNLILYFPDAGAYKRYNKIPVISKFDKKIYGEKKRNWKTHRIEGLEIHGDCLSDLPNATILMIDDIISYGGTFYYSALELKALGCNNIYAYASHTETEMLNEEKGTFIKLLNNDTVKRLFTTNSIFRQTHPKIEILKF